MNYIAFDSHKQYTWASVESSDGKILREARIEHDRGALRHFLSVCEAGSPVAVETIGNWYWIVDEIEQAGMIPHLVHARKAKLMMGMVNKTDKLDARGINRLQRNGTLPTVWIPPQDVRDQRDLPRTRILLCQQRTRFKNRIHSALAKYALKPPHASDIFGVRSRPMIESLIQQLPMHASYTTQQLWRQIENLDEEIECLERRMDEVFAEDPRHQLLMTIPGIGKRLAVVILAEIGDVGRFPSPENFTSYAGTTPRVHSSGGKTRYGQLRPDVNRYLRWAFVEAANVICIHRRRWPHLQIANRYEQLLRKRGHQKAIGAVARRLAHAAYWVLRRKEEYREPSQQRVSSTVG